MPVWAGPRSTFAVLTSVILWRRHHRSPRWSGSLKIPGRVQAVQAVEAVQVVLVLTVLVLTVLVLTVLVLTVLALTVMALTVGFSVWL